MEEKSKVVQMTKGEEPSRDSNPNEKMSYEQLEQLAHQLSEQSRMLAQRLREMEMTNTFKRIEYLFKVVESTNPSFTTDQMTKCADEIMNIIMPEEDQDNVVPDEDSN